jgi:23S rRNA pseudouridine1911/1915/1917 synthase
MRGQDRRSPGETWVEHRVTDAEAGSTVEHLLTTRLGVSRRRLQKLTRSRGMRLNGRPTFLQRKLRAGDVLAHRASDIGGPTLAPEPLQLEILFEDDDLLVLNKPSGMLVHPVGGTTGGTLAHGVAHHFERHGVQAQVRPVHRLDRATSGAVLFAKTAAMHHRLDQALRAHSITREYLAFVRGAPDADDGEIDLPIGDHPSRRGIRAVVTGGANARTRYRVEERFETATLLRVILATGRTHQVRVHLAHLGHPLLGDVQYGGPRAGIRRQALHAERLEFAHPAAPDQNIVCVAPLPEDMRTLLELLRQQPAPRAGRMTSDE